MNVVSEGPVTLTGGSQITASTLGRGAGGAVSIAASYLGLDSGLISSSTYTGGGDAGSIAIAVD